jgi:tetratricopeptide (TPR) repeat protein
MKVETALTAGNWQAAVEALGKLDDRLDSLAAVGEYALLLAACHDLAGNTARSYAALTEALRLDPQCGRALCGLGRLAALNEDLDGALLFFDAALRKSPYLVAALEGRATLNEVLGNLRSAYEDLLDASSFRPKDRELLLDVIRVGNQLGLQDELSFLLSDRTDTIADWENFQFYPHRPIDDARFDQVSG